VETRFVDGSRKILADPSHLSQVIHNLLQNALEYTAPAGEVLITMESTPGENKIVVVNTGGEIAEEDLPFIFERFYRAEKSRSRQHGGAGIGLSIVKELIEAHGGRVGAESSNNTTRIWFSLPA
jgi:signal transduction histidine kinase